MYEESTKLYVHNLSLNFSILNNIIKKKKKELKKRRETERKGKKVDKRVVEMIADFFESHRKIVEQLYNPIFISILIVRY